MGRTIGAVVVGYITVVILSILSAGILWVGLGGGAGAFASGTTMASTTWSLGDLVLGFLAAMAAGHVTALIGKHPTNMPVKVFAGLLLVLGLAMAFMLMGAQAEPLPEGTVAAELTFVEAGQLAVNPTWYLFVIPVVGAVGALVGGNLRGSKV